MGMTAEGMPLRLMAPERFQALRECLDLAGFTEAAICRRLGIPSFTDFGDVPLANRFTNRPESPQDVLIRLFLGSESLDRNEIERVLGSAALELLEEAGVLAPDPAAPDRTMAPVGLCPTRGLYLVSDCGPGARPLADDLVYPAILTTTQDFLNTLPDVRCGSLLDLGTGTGVAALLAARDYAEQAWACDITPRSALFAEFNRRLNGIGNVTVARGDLYEAVGGRTFDRIVIHPPYVPVSNPKWVFRDGGDDGETIIRRAIEGLPRHLAPGGRFYSLTLVSDRQDEPVESRIRSWLGDADAQFDVAVIAETARPPFDFIGRAMQKGLHKVDDLLYWNKVFHERKVTYLVYGCILIQRHAGEQKPFTIRHQKGPHSGRPETEWALRWNTAASGPDAGGIILNSRPRCSPHLHLAVLHRMQEGKLVPEEFLLRAQYPFEVECKCPGWVIALMQECDGLQTGLELLNSLREKGVLPPDTETSDFSDVLKLLLSSGFLEVECPEFPAVPVPPK